ncbi:hypothetical protein LIS82_13305 [Cytobacillus solani]|uniref:DUF6875 domain-containing protein n=1 Tax=Cytobacillus solani TaxID=1637975 RepID=UPI00207AAE6B|nr:hypothetical protein [Cytobacillus solani]USK57371.1 hypothetical protein LIS82_13305 [Cytobacillus solani]
MAKFQWNGDAVQLCQRKTNNMTYSFDNGKFNNYLKEMENYCPFLEPSTKKNLVNNTVITINEDEQNKIESQIFWKSVEITELFREKRKQFCNQDRLLLNSNIIFIFESNIDTNILDWPHYILKILYSNVGIVFGKFHKGAIKKSRLNGYMPSPPYTHLSIRSVIKKKDEKFFKNTPFLIDDILESYDSGENVFNKEILNSPIDFSNLSLDQREEIYNVLCKRGLEKLKINKYKNASGTSS